MKRIFVMLLIACFTVGVADAQLSKLKGLGKKLEKAAKEKVEKEADKAKEDASSKAKSEAKKQVDKAKYDLEDYEKRTENGTIVFVGDDLGMYAKAEKTNWDELQEYAYNPQQWVQGTVMVEKNALYYLYRWKKAGEEGDTENLSGEIYDRVNWCIGQVVNLKKDKNYTLEIIDYKPYATDYNNATKKFKEIMYAGKPQNPIFPTERKTQADYENYAKNSFAIWSWCVDKAIEAKNANKPITSQFYLKQAIDSREASMCVGYLKGDEAGFAEFDKYLSEALNNAPEAFKEKNKMLTADQCRAKQAAREEQWAKEEAEREAARLAEIEKNTDDWPKSNMPELDAQILKIVRAKFPDRNITRVSVMNNKWNVMMKGLVPERRVVQFWMEYYHKEAGRVIAEEHYVCQYYNGTYGKTQYQSQGARYFWVRQK